VNARKFFKRQSDLSYGFWTEKVKREEALAGETIWKARRAYKEGIEKAWEIYMARALRENKGCTRV
jgi:hypothetical protein